jgi:hypothetical protein
MTMLTGACSILACVLNNNDFAHRNVWQYPTGGHEGIVSWRTSLADYIASIRASEVAMDAKRRFQALETMCRERARVAGEDEKYWLGEADEWARFARSADPLIQSPSLQLDLLERNYR